MADPAVEALAAPARPAPVAEILELDDVLGPERVRMRFYGGDIEGLLARLRVAPARGEMITVCNTHMLVGAARDPLLATAMRAAVFSLCDGKPIAWLIGLLAGRGVERVTGPDVLDRVRARGLAEVRVALVGGDADVLERLRARAPEAARGNLLLLDPGRVAEGEGPSEAIFRALEAFRPRVVFVGLGCPKQEKWIARAIGRVPAHFLGVGAAFDYGAGNIRRAPRAMQAAGAEWIFRAVQQPRLLRRYLGTFVPFLGLLGRAALRRLAPPPPGRDRDIGV